MCRGTVMATRSPLVGEELQAERQRLRRVLREQGYSVTAQRVAAYDALLAANDHICAEHILEAIQRAHPTWRVNKTTVYRTLDLLQSLGLIREMKSSDGRAQYELTLRGPHGHLLCQRCGELWDLDPDTAAGFCREVRARSGFEVNLTSYAVQGLCQHCLGA